MINPQFNRMPYPTGRLPAPLQEFAGAVAAATRSTPEMVVTVMLATMAAAVQGVADVRTPYGETMPTSLFVSVIARSGDRKSSVLRKFTKGFEAFERGQLGTLVSEDPVPAFCSAHHPFLLEEATEKGVQDIFSDGAYSVFHALDEGAFLFSKLNMPSFCKRFDGSPIRSVSRTGGIVSLHDRRTSLCLLTQDITFERFMKKKGELLVESGFMPRILVAQALAQTDTTPCLPGTLPFMDSDSHWFHQRVRELMQAYAASLGRAPTSRQELSLDAAATQAWETHDRHINQLLACSGEWEDIRAFMRRSGEQVIRAAAVLQYFTDPGEQIRLWAVQAAIDIVRWHLCEVKRIFGEESWEMRAVRMAQKIYDYMGKRLQRTGISCFSKSELLRYAPSALRNAESLDLALHTLLAYGRITLFKQGGKEYVAMNSWPQIRPLPPGFQ